MRQLTAVAFSLFALAGSATAAEKIGTATLIKTAVSGDYGAIVVRAPVHRNERIRTSQSGLGEFLFRDGTKLAVGWGSNVVVDNFVFDDSGTAKKLTIKAAKGTFRWISGKSVSTAYEIKTPAGTIGVRGTKFDFYVDANGTTAVVLLSGAAQFCGAGGCVPLRRRCDCVVAQPGRRPSVSRAGRQVLTTLGNSKALPFLTGNQSLSGRFGASTGCGMGVAALQQNERKAGKSDEPTKTPTATDPTPEAPTPNKPDKPNTPSVNPNTPTPNAPTPNAPTPNTPTPNTPTPNTPAPSKGGHGYGDKNHTHTHNPQGHGKGGNPNKGGNGNSHSQR